MLVSHRSHHGGSIIPQVGTPQQGRQNLPHQAIPPSPNTMTSNPTCPDCGRPFKTSRGLSIHRNQCPRRQMRTTQNQRLYRSGPQSERERGASNWHSGDENPWVDRKFYSGSSTSSVQTNIIERSHRMAATHRFRKQRLR